VNDGSDDDDDDDGDSDDTSSAGGATGAQDVSMVQDRLSPTIAQSSPSKAAGHRWTKPAQRRLRGALVGHLMAIF